MHDRGRGAVQREKWGRGIDVLGRISIYQHAEEIIALVEIGDALPRIIVCVRRDPGWWLRIIVVPRICKLLWLAPLL